MGTSSPQLEMGEVALTQVWLSCRNLCGSLSPEAEEDGKEVRKLGSLVNLTEASVGLSEIASVEQCWDVKSANQDSKEWKKKRGSPPACFCLPHGKVENTTKCHMLCGPDGRQRKSHRPLEKMKGGGGVVSKQVGDQAIL